MGGVSRPAVERRRSPRYLCSHVVEIRRGGQVAAALLEDLCLEGAGVAVETWVETGEAMELVAPGLQARARVCYCRPRENDFVVGIHFDEDFRWRPDQWRPDHLFLPPSA